MRFGFITVGLLAVAGFSSCGVGADDVEGQQAAAYAPSAVASSDQALIGLSGTPATGEGEQAPPAAGAVNPGISSLPSDPVPMHQPNPEAGNLLGNPYEVPVAPPSGMPGSR